MERVICPYCSGGIWSVLYAPIVVGYVEFVICSYCSWVYGVCYIPLL